MNKKDIDNKIAFYEKVIKYWRSKLSGNNKSVVSRRIEKYVKYNLMYYQQNPTLMVNELKQEIKRLQDIKRQINIEKYTFILALGVVASIIMELFNFMINGVLTKGFMVAGYVLILIAILSLMWDKLSSILDFKISKKNIYLFFILLFLGLFFIFYGANNDDLVQEIHITNFPKQTDSIIYQDLKLEQNKTKILESKLESLQNKYIELYKLANNSVDNKSRIELEIYSPILLNITS